jgi:GTP pyrophosphokinase
MGNKKEVSLYENLIAKFKHYYPNDYGLLVEVFEFAKNAHKGQERESKEEYFTHPCYVAEILVDMDLGDVSMICAALLHDVVEDTDVSKEQIENKYGKDVAMLVESVTKLDSLQFKSREEEQAENIRKMLLAMAKDKRVIMIKLADRLHNMRTLSFLPPEKQQRIARETMDIYAPIASRLGLSYIKCELEDLCFKYLELEKYEKIVAAVSAEQSIRQAIVERAMRELRQKLSEIGITGEVSGRPKHIYSIYRKMTKRNKSLDQIYDLTAIRVIVKSVEDCYAILGTIHAMWKPIADRIKDYISVPKANMYQSLHTSVVTSFGERVEIQIRTAEMHEIAERGIAAHWKYKEGIVEKPENKAGWTNLPASLEDELSPKEFLESTKNELNPDNEIFVYTPIGDVKRLQADSTPIDFAYAIHSEVGNRCVGAKVNSKMAPLGAALSTGDVVEIITSASSKGPGRDWLKIVKTASAKAKIKQYLKREMKDEYIKTGRAMLELDAKRKGYAFSALATAGGLSVIYAAYSFSSVDEIYASVGFGSITGNQILTKLIDHYKKNTATAVEVKPAKPSNRKGKGQSVIIKGFDDLLIRFAKCCSPLPGDDIIGFVSRGRGVSVHRADCPSVKNFEPERIIGEVSWSQKSGADFTGTLHIVANDKNGLVAQITKIINNLKFSIVAIKARVDKTKICNITVEVKINKADDLNVLIDKLKAYPPVLEVQR